MSRSFLDHLLLTISSFLYFDVQSEIFYSFFHCFSVFLTFWFMRAMTCDFLVQMSPGVLYFGLFNGIGSMRTQSKMV